MRAYRTAFNIHVVLQKTFHTLNRLHNTRSSKGFWNIIRITKQPCNKTAAIYDYQHWSSISVKQFSCGSQINSNEIHKYIIYTAVNCGTLTVQFYSRFIFLVSQLNRMRKDNVYPVRTVFFLSTVHLSTVYPVRTVSTQWDHCEFTVWRCEHILWDAGGPTVVSKT